MNTPIYTDAQGGSNTSSGYFSNVEEFGDKVTYSTNTLESAVTVTWPSNE